MKFGVILTCRDETRLGTFDPLELYQTAASSRLAPPVRGDCAGHCVSWTRWVSSALEGFEEHGAETNQVCFETDIRAALRPQNEQTACLARKPLIDMLHGRCSLSSLVLLSLGLRH